MRTLITGGSGFIGSHLTQNLLAAGRSVVVVDNLSTGRRSNLPDSHEKLTFIEADLADVVAELGQDGELGAFDEIYHLAAAVGVKLVMERPAEAIETNVSLTADLLTAAMESGPGGKPRAGAPPAIGPARGHRSVLQHRRTTTSRDLRHGLAPVCRGGACGRGDYGLW